MIKLANGKVYVTITEAAAILGVTEGRVSQFLVDERLKANTKLVGKKLLLKSEVLEFKKNRSTKPGRIPTEH